MRAVLVSLMVGGVMAVSAHAAEPITVTVGGIEGAIPEKFAHCVATDTEKSGSGQNTSPAIRWTAGPEGTKSYAVVVVDPDVPTDFTDAGKEGKTIPDDMHRQPFYHWVAFNIPASWRAVEEGAGKTLPVPVRMATNDYLTFSGEEKTPESIAKYTGYDGPCPPWNDERMHHYHFKVLALDVENVELPADVAAADAVNTLTTHVLAEGEVVGTYTLNPALK